MRASDIAAHRAGDCWTPPCPPRILARVSQADALPEAPAYDRRIGLFTATLLVVGGIIGSGIFLNPAIVAQRVGSASLTLGVWALGAVIARHSCTRGRCCS